MVRRSPSCRQTSGTPIAAKSFSLAIADFVISTSITRSGGGSTRRSTSSFGRISSALAI
jgi:hypothetical protein